MIWIAIRPNGQMEAGDKINDRRMSVTLAGDIKVIRGISLLRRVDSPSTVDMVTPRSSHFI